MLDNIKPGQKILCTVQSNPRSEGARKTLIRLMRCEHETKQRAKKAQLRRMDTLYVRSRGKRPWEVRRKSGKLVSPVEGEKWTMTFIPQLAGDLRSIERYVSVEAA